MSVSEMSENASEAQNQHVKIDTDTKRHDATFDVRVGKCRKIGATFDVRVGK